jgi:hypothetical protein
VTVLEPCPGEPQASSVTVGEYGVEIRYGPETHRITVDQAGRVYRLGIL